MLPVVSILPENMARMLATNLSGKITYSHLGWGFLNIKAPLMMHLTITIPTCGRYFSRGNDSKQVLPPGLYHPMLSPKGLK